jgi:hypothetical protein
MQKASRSGNRLFFFQFQHAKGNWQIKAGPLLADIGRGQFDGDPFPVWPGQRAVGKGGGDPIFAFFDRGTGNPTTAILSVLPHPAWTSISTSNASTLTTAAE